MSRQTKPTKQAKGKSPKGSAKGKGAAKQRSGQVDRAPPVALPMARKKVNEPRVSTGRNGTVRVVHSELIGYANYGSTVVAGWGLDTDLPIYLSPTNTNLFTWLPTIAGNFEEYRFKKLVFWSESLAGTTDRGGYTMAVDYDPVDPLPATAVALEAGMTRGSSKIWGDMKLHVDVKDTGAGKLLFTGAPPTGTDMKTYYAGQLIIAYESLGALSNGMVKFNVDYEVELYKPQAPIAPTMSAKIYGPLASSYATGLTYSQAGKKLATLSNSSTGDIMITWQDTGNFLVTLANHIIANSGLLASTLTSAYAQGVTDGPHTKSSVIPGALADSLNQAVSVLNTGGALYNAISDVVQALFTFNVAVDAIGGTTTFPLGLAKGAAIGGAFIASYLTLSKKASPGQYTIANWPLQCHDTIVAVPKEGEPHFTPYTEVPSGNPVAAYLVPAPSGTRASSDRWHPVEADDHCSSDGEHDDDVELIERLLLRLRGRR